MHFKGDAETMSLDGRSKGRPIEGAPQDTVLYVQLFPNLLISGHPDYVMTHRVLPLAAASFAPAMGSAASQVVSLKPAPARAWSAVLGKPATIC